jgi:uncharacterized protein YcaQ
MTEQLSLSQARLLALAGQGLTKSTKPSSVLETIDTMGVLQIDSVNVFERAHYMPLFSRLGPYDKTELDNLHGGKHPTLLEYWAHEASFIRTEHYPLFGYRMEYNQRGTRSRYEKWADENREFLDWIKSEIRTRGPLSGGDFEHERAERKGSWWGWSDVKRALEFMFMYGEVVSGGREGFNRLYALPEQVLPAKVRNKTEDPIASRKKLLLKAAKAHGVGTATDLADYFRMNAPLAKKLLQELVEDKKLIATQVEGWKEQAFILPDTQVPKEKPVGTTLLSPFDPLVWHRPRTERLWDFHYRIEIYTPEPKRVFGYYSLPILWHGQIAGRIDLKNDRQSKILLVQSAWHEPGIDPAALAKDLSKHLAQAAKWQGCKDIELKKKGNLSAALAKAV